MVNAPPRLRHHHQCLANHSLASASSPRKTRLNRVLQFCKRNGPSVKVLLPGQVMKDTASLPSADAVVALPVALVAQAWAAHQAPTAVQGVSHAPRAARAVLGVKVRTPMTLPLSA